MKHITKGEGIFQVALFLVILGIFAYFIFYKAPAGREARHIENQKLDSECFARFQSGSKLEGSDDKCLDYYESEIANREKQKDAENRVREINSKISASGALTPEGK